MAIRTLLATGFVLATGSPRLSYAQTTPYAGIGANLLTSVPFASRSQPTLLGPSVTAGLQFNPHLALQTGVALHWQHESFGYSYYDPTTGVNTSSSDYHTTYFTIPVLLRYTFTAPAARLAVDALGGGTLLVARTRGSYYYNYGGDIYTGDNNGSSAAGALTLGPAVRYTVGPHVDLTANALVSAIFTQPYYQFSDRLSLNLLVGAQYAFGAR